MEERKVTLEDLDETVDRIKPLVERLEEYLHPEQNKQKEIHYGK